MLINENIMIKWLIWLPGVNVCEQSKRATENVKIRFTGKKLSGYREEKHFWKVSVQVTTKKKKSNLKSESPGQWRNFGAPQTPHSRGAPFLGGAKSLKNVGHFRKNLTKVLAKTRDYAKNAHLY